MIRWHEGSKVRSIVLSFLIRSSFITDSPYYRPLVCYCCPTIGLGEGIMWVYSYFLFHIRRYSTISCPNRRYTIDSCLFNTFDNGVAQRRQLRILDNIIIDASRRSSKWLSHGSNWSSLPKARWGSQEISSKGCDQSFCIPKGIACVCLVSCCAVVCSAVRLQTGSRSFLCSCYLFFSIFFYWSCSPRRWCSFFLLLNVSFCWAGIVFRLISGWIFDCSGQWKACWMLTMAWMDSPCSGLCNALGFLQIDRAQVILCGSAVNGRILLH